jgi:hypothetical protein
VRKKQGIAIGMPLMMCGVLLGELSRSPAWATMRRVDTLSLFAAGLALFALGLGVGGRVRNGAKAPPGSFCPPPGPETQGPTPSHPQRP